MDTNPVHTKDQPENAIILSPWKGDPKDNDLIGYVPFLEYIATMGINDVRDAIKSFEGKHIPTEYARREAALREEFNRQLAEQRAKKPKISAGGFLTSALGLKPQGGMTMDGQHSVAEGLMEGKMLQDQIRERGMKQYEALEKDIRENGEKWLKMEAEMEKQAQQEQMKSAKAWTTTFWGQPKEGEGETKQA
jgi:mitochondrial import inner membrane translocase subunit TIM50